MGYIKHHAIVITSSGYREADQALTDIRRAAQGLGMVVSDIQDSRINGYKSFLVCPDGSKEGWTDSDEGDAARAALKKRLCATRYDDGSGPLAWVEVQYGDDNNETLVVAHSDECVCHACDWCGAYDR